MAKLENFKTVIITNPKTFKINDFSDAVNYVFVDY